MNNSELMKVRQKALDGFLAQQELRRQLSEVDTDAKVQVFTPEADVADHDECARHVAPFDSEIEAGQVRMLSGTERPTYALVARKWDANSWLVIPFSDYSNPATETELKIRTPGGIGLRVLQLWNARSQLEQTIAKSWLVTEFTQEDLEDALGAWQWSVGIGELSEDQLARTGLPIMRRDDPRIEYEDEELANFAKLDAADMAAVERMELFETFRENLAGCKLGPFKEADAFAADYALAAGDAEKAVSAECRVAGFDGSVYVRYFPSTRSLNISVFDAAGNRSPALDGWSVLGSDAEPLGAIDRTFFEHSFANRFDGVLALADGEGNVFPLMEAP